ncbi:MAG: glycosyltransferase family 4 protein, partial [Chloroflexota bacterium]
VDDYSIQDAVTFLPRVARDEMGDLVRQAQVIASPSEHDGTPNSLLEAIACGCFPVAGDIESVREWITGGKNGLLFDPGDPEAISQAILRGLTEAELRESAQGINQELIMNNADYKSVMAKASAFINSIIA